MFNDSDSFYYCETADLTSTIQRRHQQQDTAAGPDDRFFWNKHLLTELVDSQVHSIVHLSSVYSVTSTVIPPTPC